MRGFKLLATTALAANENAVRRQTSGLQKMKQPTVADENVFGRRKALQHIMAVGTVALSAPAFALDMDTFMNSELQKDTTNCDPKKDRKCVPKLSADEALCKYGQSGDARGEACKRVKAAGGSLPGAAKEKSLGGAYAM